MTAVTKLVALAISCFAMLAVPMGATAEAKPARHHWHSFATNTARHHRHSFAAKTTPHYWHSLQQTSGRPVWRMADASFVDCHGWRKWHGAVGYVVPSYSDDLPPDTGIEGGPYRGGLCYRCW